MKTNQEYKNAALSRIRGNWAPLIVASIVFLLIALLCVGAREWDVISDKLSGLAFFVPSTSGIKALVEGCGLLAVIFILGPLGVGYDNALRVFYESGDTDATSNMFSIATGNYLHIVWTYVLMTVKIFLWTLLLIVPGIIKSYAYALTPFIVVEHPELSASEAIAESERLMEGHKFDLFWLQLSFIGWFILCLLTMGIGFFWLEPYAETSFVAFYEDIKAEDNPLDGVSAPDVSE